MSYEIRPATVGEMDFIIGLARDEGWNPGVHDAAAFHAADPDGFLIGVLDGDPIAACSAVRYGDRFGFIGFYIVRPEFRGQGYGLQIWNAVLERCGDRVLGLDAVVDQEATYARSGFQTAYPSRRHMLRGGPDALHGLTPLGPDHVDAIMAWDRSVFPGPRRSFWQSWLAQPGTVGYGAFVAGGGLAGFGVMRPALDGYKIGPLVAASDDLAEEILFALIAEADEGAPVTLDVPEAAGNVVAWIERLGAPAVFETRRMYRGTPPRLDLQYLYGVTTFELG